MKRQLTFPEYRAMDLFFFAVMLTVSELLITFAARTWFPGQPYSVSVAAAVTAIALMRWGAWGLIHGLLGGIVFCAASGATAQQYVIYCVGNLGCAASLLLIRFLGSEKIRGDKLLSLLFALCTQLAMQLGRALTALCFGYSPETCLGFLTTDALSALFTMVIVWIARRLDGIFEDQKHYLLRVQKQNDNKKGGF